MPRSKVGLDPVEERARKALNVVMRLYDLTDADVAQALGWRSRQKVEQRRSGHTRIRSGEHDVFAEALGIDASVFRMEMPEILEWFAQRPELVASTIMCFPMSAGSPRLAHAS